MSTVYVGQYPRIYDGEEAIYQIAPHKEQGILSQVAGSRTLDGAKREAKRYGDISKVYIIYAADKDKYFVYI